MSRQALELALEALERSVATCFDQRSHDAVMGRPEHFVNRAITAIKEALAQPEYQSTADKSKLEKVPAKGTLLAQPEPVMHTLNCVCGAVWDIKTDGSEEMVHTPYTTPPQRTWVGLTDEQRMEMWRTTKFRGNGGQVDWFIEGTRAAETALREALAEQKSGIKQVIELYDSPDQPAQRTWQGLTHEQVDSWELPDCPTVFEFAQFIEAKLKERNS